MKKLIIFTPPPEKSHFNEIFQLIHGKTRKSACALSLALCVTLTACSTTSANSKRETTENAPSTSETSTPSQEKVSPIDSQAETSSINESILSVCPNASISEEDGTLSIDLSECYDSTSDEYIRNLLHDCARIIGTSNFADKYSGLSFSYVDKNFISALTVTEFNNISDYYTSLICTKTENGDDNYYAAYSILYKKLFHNHDINNRQLIEQGKIADKYGVNGRDATADPEPEDELWFYSFFDDSVLFSFENGILAANYRIDTDDYFQYGYDVYTDLSAATESFKTYFANSSKLITAQKLVFICFDGQSDTRLCEFIYDRDENDTFKLSVNYLNDDFKEGVLSKYNETE